MRSRHVGEGIRRGRYSRIIDQHLADPGLRLALFACRLHLGPLPTASVGRKHAAHASQRALALTVTCSDDGGGSVQATLSLATNDTDRPIVRLP